MKSIRKPCARMVQRNRILADEICNECLWKGRRVV